MHPEAPVAGTSGHSTFFPENQPLSNSGENFFCRDFHPPCGFAGKFRFFHSVSFSKLWAPEGDGREACALGPGLSPASSLLLRCHQSWESRSTWQEGKEEPQTSACTLHRFSSRPGMK